jgi:hypothetical protein
VSIAVWFALDVTIAGAIPGTSGLLV